MNSIILVILLGAFTAAQAGIFDFSKDWNTLRVTWGLRPGWALNALPRTLDENAKSTNNKFALKDDQCKNGDGKFFGQRYTYNNDQAVILLFDAQGTIAGMQTSVLKTEFTPAQVSQEKYLVSDGDYWTITAYFVDPSTICSKGRSADELKNGTGTGLWLQYGPNPIADSVNIPLNEDDIKKTKWGHGKCFVTMGQHYWFNISKSMDCGDVAPNCLLYNGGKLTGFCFAPNYYLDSSKRYDFPAPEIKVLTKFLDPVPDCFYTDPSFAKQSTVHVFFQEHPEATSWC